MIITPKAAEHSELIWKTINADIKHLGVKIKDGLIWKNGIAFGDLPIEPTEQDIFLFLRGMSAVFDNKELFGVVK